MASLNSSALAAIPALAPPPNTLPDFGTSFKGLQLTYTVVTAVCLVLATVIIVARFVAKLTVDKTYHREDFATIITWLLFVAYCVLTWVAIRDGVGRHQWDLSISQGIEVAKISNYGEIFYQVTLCAGKVGILFEYQRIFCPSRHGPTNRTILVFMGLVVIAYAFITFWIIFQCVPREKIWNPFVPGHCVKADVGILISASWSVFSDFAILALPILSIWRLKMSVKRKLGVTAIFAIGLLCCIASIVRLVYTVRFFDQQDQNFAVVLVGIWTLVEATLVVLVGSLPKMPQFFKVVLRRNKKKNSYDYPSAYPSHAKSTEDSRKASHPFSSVGSNSVPTWLNRDESSSFVPLKDLEPVHSVSVAAVGRADSPDDNMPDPENTIRKTVRVETQRGNSDPNIASRYNR